MRKGRQKLLYTGRDGKGGMILDWEIRGFYLYAEKSSLKNETRNYKYQINNIVKVSTNKACSVERIRNDVLPP
jgi:hypothetical protein